MLETPMGTARQGQDDVPSVDAAAEHPGPDPTTELEACPNCASRLVQPLDWGPAGKRRWRLARRCPECEWRGTAVHAQEEVDRYDEILDRATERLVGELRTKVRANMSERIDAFVGALGSDAILPEDF